MNHLRDIFRQIHRLSEAEVRNKVRGNTSTAITVLHGRGGPSYRTIPYPVVPLTVNLVSQDT